MEITMNLQYAAGHTGTFEMAYSCGGTTEDDLSAVSRSYWRAACCVSTRSGGAGVGGRGWGVGGGQEGMGSEGCGSSYDCKVELICLRRHACRRLGPSWLAARARRMARLRLTLALA